MSQSNVFELLNEGRSFLKRSNIDSYSIDALVLLMNSSGMTKTEIYVNKDKTLNKEQEQCYKKALIKRAKNEPVQYIIGKAEFMGLTFMRNSATLIPRPDTETLVEICIDKIKKNKYKFVLDLACGSGAIGISIAKYCKDVFVACSDIDKDAVSMSIKNAKLNGVYENMNFYISNLFEKLEMEKYDIIVSNPPYIPTEDISFLMPEVRDFEPVKALDGGIDGLDFYKIITKKSIKHLNKNGMLFYEIGSDQKKAVLDIMAEYGFKSICSLKDLAGLDRVVYANI